MIPPPYARFIKELESSLTGCPPGLITMDLRFRDQPWWDSLATLTLLAVFDETFGKPLSVTDLMECKTIGDVCRRA